MSRSRIFRSIGAVLGIALVSLLVMRTSSAVFTANTDDTGNAWASGQVNLIDDDSGSAMFNASNLVPGDVVTKCIVVTYNGTTPNPAAVKLYTTGITNGGLAPHLDVVIREGTGGSFGGGCGGFVASSTAYTGTLAAFASHSNYSTGVGVFDPSATPQSATYQFQVTLGADTPNSAMSTNAIADFQWEVQS